MQMTQKISLRSVHAILAFGILLSMMTGCKSTDKHNTGSGLEGFSANNNAQTKNVALMMTSYGSTPGMADQFAQDNNNLYAVLSDPKTHYNFKINNYSQVGHYQMIAAVQSSAAEVTTDGTLLVFITAHGANNGTIQPADQQFATFGYQNILDAIRAGRKNKGKFQRLVIVISACYSGTWLNTLTSSDDVATQRLVMTSVTSDSLSYVGSATAAMYQTFLAFKDKPNVSMATFLATAQAQSGNMLQYSVNDRAILTEPFISRVIIPEADGTLDISTIAMTIQNGSDTTLYIYASKEIESMSFVDGTGNPYSCTMRAQPQTQWPWICFAKVEAGYLKLSTIKGLVTVDGKTYSQTIDLAH